MLTELFLVALVSADRTPADVFHFRVHDEEYAVELELFDAPIELDLDAADGSWQSPWDAIHSYHAAMLDLETLPVLRDHQRLFDGTLAPPRMDDAQLVQAARKVLSGPVMVHGTVEWEDTTIFLYRYHAASVTAWMGMPFRRIEGDYRLVKDLTQSVPLFRELSAATWDVNDVHAEFGVEPASTSFGHRWLVIGGAALGLVLIGLYLRGRASA